MPPLPGPLPGAGKSSSGLGRPLTCRDGRSRLTSGRCSMRSRRAMPDTGGGIGLPPLFPLRGFEGSVSEYVARLSWQYRAMVDHAGIRIWGKPLTVSTAAAGDGRDRLFWHLITSGTSEGDGEARRLDLTRCAHLPRVWELLERGAAADPRVRLWRQVDWYGQHVRVAARDWSMVAVLLERPSSLVLKTASPLEARTRGALRSQARASWMRVWAERVSSE